MEAVGSLVPTHFHNLLYRDAAGGQKGESLLPLSYDDDDNWRKVGPAPCFSSVTFLVSVAAQTQSTVDVGSLVTVMCMSGLETGIELSLSSNVD